MRPRLGLRPTAFTALIALIAVGSLSGCVYFANADPEITALRQFATGLDGVTAVDELENGPANMANPFSDAADAVVLITVEGDDWRETMPLVADAVIDWLDTKQTNRSVDLGAGVAFPGGVIGLADADTTTARIQLAEVFAADTRVTSAEIGWHESPSNYPTNDLAPVDVERRPSTSVSEIAAHWMPALIDFGPLSVSVPAPAESPGVDGTTLGQRFVQFDAASADLTAYLGWFDAVDGMTDVQGWRANSRSATVAVRPEASLTDTETALRALPGFDQVAPLTLLYGEITLESDGTATTARTAAELLVGDPRFTDIVPSIHELEATVSDFDAARDLIALVETVPDAANLPLTLRFDTPNNETYINEVAVGDAREWIDLVDSVPNDIDVDSIQVFGSDQVVVTLTGAYDSARTLAVFESIHDQTISVAASVSLNFNAEDGFFIAQFEAAPTISASAVSAGRNGERTPDHDDVVEIWNSLG